MSAAGSGLPEHEQRAWDAIVADLSGQIDLGPEFTPPPEVTDPTLDTAAAPVAGPTPAEAADDDDVEEGYVPPHPPPIPRPADAIGRFSWGAVLSGPVLVLLATVFGWDRWIANLGVVLTVGGFVSLVWRMNDRDDDDDDGAVI